MRTWIRYLIHESFISRWLYPIIYRKWLKRYQAKEGFLSGSSLHDYLDPVNIYQFHPKATVSFKLPTCIGDNYPIPQQINFYVGKTFEVTQGEVYTFQNAYLIGENAVGLTNDGNIILDTAMDLPNVLHKCNPRLLMNYDKTPSDISIKRAVSLVHIFCNAHYVNYFHWINDSLLLLEGLEAYQNHNDVRVIINDNTTSFQLEYLSLLGYKKEQLVTWGNYKKASIQELIVVKSRRTGTNMDEIVAPQALTWLNCKLRSSVRPNINLPKRVFLTRQHTSSRRIVNYDELQPILNGFDITVVNTDELNVTEQIQLFRNIELIVAPHGAGLTNIIFSNQLTILELIGNVDTPDDFQWYCAYYSIAQVMQHRYSYIEGETIPLLKANRTKQIYDLKIDPIAFQERLECLIDGIEA